MHTSVADTLFIRDYWLEYAKIQTIPCPPPALLCCASLPHIEAMSSTDAPSFGLSGSAGIDHIVLIKAKPGTTEAEENALFEGVKSLSSIPGERPTD